MLGDLTDKTALITGGAKGIGRGIALIMAQQGADVAVVDIATDEARTVAEEIEALGRNAVVFNADVAVQEQVDAAVRHAVNTFGHLDILVNNAGIATTGEETLSTWQRTFDINLMGTVRCCDAVVPHMKKRRYGKIINIASMAGHAARRSGGAYATAKAAVLRYTKGLAFELAPHNINVNAICPGAVWTPLQEGNVQYAQENDPELAKLEPYDVFLLRYEPVTPMGRPQTVEDIGKMAAFIASDDARNVTGQCFHVDGGAILRD